MKSQCNDAQTHLTDVMSHIDLPDDVLERPGLVVYCIDTGR